MSDAANNAEEATPLGDLAADLQRALGQRLVAYAVGVSSPKLVGRWASGAAPQPPPDAERRLRTLHRVKETLVVVHDDRTIRAFLVGANPDLDDHTPIDTIRDGHGIDAIRAAQAFLR